MPHVYLILKESYWADCLRMTSLRNHKRPSAGGRGMACMVQGILAVAPMAAYTGDIGFIWGAAETLIKAYL